MTEGNRATKPTSATARRGRPAGLLLNPQAVLHLLGDRPQVELVAAARLIAPVLSELMSGQRGASLAIATRLAAALECEPGVIFPEMVGFTTTVRYFTANGAWVSE
jgi:CTP:molybdopterin cytidylyltransferase MocA